MTEFDFIARVLRPLTFGAPEALGLSDDAAVVPSRLGFDLVITKDAMVEGVHFLPDDPPGQVAQKLLRVNLSDLAAKGAEPYGYFLAVAWPGHMDAVARAAFAAGLEADQRRFGLKLFGGDTVSTPGSLTLSATLLGWVPTGAVVRRDGARPGHRVLLSGTIGDGSLGLRAAQGGLEALGMAHREALATRYRLPEPRLALGPALRAHASAAADVSDGLVADLGHIAAASSVGMRLHLEDLPLSDAARAWLHGRDPAAALTELAGLGDDYEVIATASPDRAAALIAAGDGVGVSVTDIGEVVEGERVAVLFRGAPVSVARTGWVHP